MTADVRNRRGSAVGEPKIVSQVVQAALGIAALLWSCPSHQLAGYLVARRDVMALLDGHIEAWSGWTRLDEGARLQVARLLRHRPSQLANEELLDKALNRLLADDGLPGCGPLQGTAGETIVVAPGMALSDFVDATLDELDRLRLLGSRCLASAGAGEYGDVLRVAVPGSAHGNVIDATYQVRWAAEETPPPRLLDADPVAELAVSAQDLYRLAARLDAALDGQHAGGYREASVRRLFHGLRCDQGPVGELWRLAAGPTQVLNAPTGVGKSVLMEVLACWAASQRLVTTLVVSTNAEVLRLAAGIERALTELAIDAEVTPLISPAALMRTAVSTVRQRPSWDPFGEWTYARLGYGCALVAAAATEEPVDAWQPGQEACTGLWKSTRGTRKARAHACPWRPTCGKFRLARAACTATVIVTSHANFTLGRVQAPVDDGHGVTDRLTVEELVLRRSHLLMIDEVDAFQASMLRASARGVTLVDGRQTRTPLRQLDTEFGEALGRLHPEIDAEVRDALSATRFLAETYVSHLTHGRLHPTRPKRGGPGPSRSWLVPRRWDGWLAARLNGLGEDEPIGDDHMQTLRSLFLEEGDPSSVPEALRPVRENLHAVATPGSGARLLETCHIELDHLLVGRVPDRDERLQVVDRLLRRAYLERLRRLLFAFVHNAPQLAAAGIGAADELVEALGSHARWQATPNGPLGRLVFAFTEHVDDSRPEDTQLRAAAFGGDPHSYTATLGDVIALCHARTRRIVVGLSATAYFPRAPHHHVHTRPTWWIRDDTPEAVTLLQANVTDADQSPVRVSGRLGRDRDEAQRLMGRLLWARRLHAELDRLAAEQPDRARVLLATTSYDGARLLAEGVAAAGASPRRICLLVRSRPAGEGSPPAELVETGRWWELPADRVEDFPAIPGADVLIAPLARVQRGVNIIGTADRSALGSVWLAVRPVPVLDEPAELVAHVNAAAMLAHRSGDNLAELLHARRKTAGWYFEEVVKCQPYFRALPEDVRLSVAAEIMVGLLQLVGRARRGGTSAVIHLADYAFLDPTADADFATMIRRLRDRWLRDGVLDSMTELYGSALDAFFAYADRQAVEQLERR